MQRDEGHKLGEADGSIVEVVCEGEEGLQALVLKVGWQTVCGLEETREIAC